MSKGHVEHISQETQESQAREEARTTGLSLKISGDLLKKLIPYFIGAGVVGGSAGYVKTSHDSEAQELKIKSATLEQKVDRLDGKVDLVVELLKAQRRSR